jgi:Ca-activated chloride channel homolog
MKRNKTSFKTIPSLLKQDGDMNKKPRHPIDERIKLLMQLAFLCLGIVLMLIPGSAHAQQGKKHIREGNRLYQKEDFQGSELEYRRALENNQKSTQGRFNLGNSLYRQDRFSEAAKAFGDISLTDKDPAEAAGVYHNLGNALLQEGNLEQSIEAYKQALRLNPHDEETRYNLAYAQHLLNNQEEQDQNSRSDNQDEQDDQQNQKDPQQDDGQKEDSSQQKNQQDQEGNEELEQEQPQERISREDAERMLQAVENEERDLQDKLNREKASQRKVRVTRNW